MLMLGTAVIMAALALQPIDATLPLQPSGKWTVAYEADSCILSRDFGVGADKLTLAITPAVIGNRTEIALVSGNIGNAIPNRGTASIRIGEMTFLRGYSSVASSKDRVRITRTQLYRSDMNALPKAASIRMPIGRDRNATLALAGTSGALKAVAACVADLQKRANIGPEITSQAIGDAIPTGRDDWFSADSYPPEALRANIEGDSVIVWSVGTDGRPHGCRAIGPARNKILDEQGCRVIYNKARYLPAKDGSGVPITSNDGTLIRWRLPR